MKFDVSVQGSFYKTIEAENTGAVLSAVANDIANNEVPNFVPGQPHNIVIVPKNN